LLPCINRTTKPKINVKTFIRCSHASTRQQNQKSILKHLKDVSCINKTQKRKAKTLLRFFPHTPT
jgi:hypothetical protein